MPGREGNDTLTILNLSVVKIDLTNNVLLVSGNVPGSKKSLLIIRSAVKKQNN